MVVLFLMQVIILNMNAVSHHRQAVTILKFVFVLLGGRGMFKCTRTLILFGNGGSHSVVAYDPDLPG